MKFHFTSSNSKEAIKAKEEYISLYSQTKPELADIIIPIGGDGILLKCLHDFNYNWARRVLSRGSIVLLISDGLDRDSGVGLSKEVDKIKRSCNRLIWLNPLLRFDQFSPRSMGVRAILPNVHEFRPVHSLNSLTELAQALGTNNFDNKNQMQGWIKKLHEIESETKNKVN